MTYFKSVLKQWLHIAIVISTYTANLESHVYFLASVNCSLTWKAQTNFCFIFLNLSEIDLFFCEHTKRQPSNFTHNLYINQLK